MEKQEFKQYVKSVVSEIKSEKNKSLVKENFINLVKTLLEEVKSEKEEEKKSGDNNKKESYLNQEKSKYKSDIDKDPSKTPTKLVSSLKSVVSKIGKKIQVVLDEHDTIVVKQPGVFYIRIKTKWNDRFDVAAYRNMTDLVRAVGLDFNQVIDFVKVNFVNSDKKTAISTSRDKSMENMEDNSKKKSKELPKTEPVKHMEVKDKDIENAVTDKKDEPTAQMSPVNEKDIEKQSDHGVEKNKEMPKIQKMVKKEIDSDLTKNFKK